MVTLRYSSTPANRSSNHAAHWLLYSIRPHLLIDAVTVLPTGYYTVFVPTNEAFAALPTELLDLVQGNMTVRTNILQYHALPAIFRLQDAFNDLQLKASNGQDIRINVYREGDSVSAVRAGRRIGKTHGQERRSGVWWGGVQSIRREKERGNLNGQDIRTDVHCEDDCACAVRAGQRTEEKQG